MEAQQTVNEEVRKPRQKKRVALSEMEPAVLSDLMKAKDKTAKDLQAALEEAQEKEAAANTRIEELEKKLKEADKKATDAVADKLDAERKAVNAISELESERRKYENLLEAHDQRKNKVEKIKAKKRDLFEQNKEISKELENLQKIDRNWVRVSKQVEELIGRNGKLSRELEVTLLGEAALEKAMKRGELQLKNAVDLLVEVVKTHPQAAEFISKLKEVTGREVEAEEAKDEVSA